MIDGLLNLSWLGVVLWVFTMTHITVTSVKIFLHGHQAHRSLDLDSATSDFFQFWLWVQPE
jgi:stearoyl-CoA desaturase (Delta-9 desaturase)